MNIQGIAGLGSNGAAAAGGGIPFNLAVGTHFHVVCRDKHGNVKWTEDFHNLVVTAGRNELIDKTFKGSGYTAAWYGGLVSATPTVAAGDTMSSHAGWTEVTAYDEAVRQTLTLGTVASGSANNSGSPMVFTISSDGTAVGGLFITTVSTKGGTTGTLYGAGAFTGGNKTLSDNDTLTVTATLSITAS